MLDVCLLGTGGMMPLPKRFLTALMLKYNGSNMLIDCGEGTQIAIRQKGWSTNPIDIICFTHMHADHISGIPGLLLSMGNSDRREPITIIGPKGIEKVVKSLCIIAQELPFNINFIEILDDEMEFNINGYIIKAFKVKHNITCYGYTINIERNGKFDILKAQHLNIPQIYWNKLQKGQTITVGNKTYEPEMILGPKRKGIKVSYVTDTRPAQSIIDNCYKSDLFICEGMYGDEEMIKKSKDKKHMTFYEAADMAKKINAVELWLTHYSPSLTRPEQYIGKVTGIFENTKAGKDGMSKDLIFEEE